MAPATGLRVAWVLAVPTVPVSDFAMYRESANYLSEFGSLDPGFIYMPGFVALLAWVKNLGGDLLAQKLIGVAFGGIGAAGLFVLSYRLVDDDQDGTLKGSRDGLARAKLALPHAIIAPPPAGPPPAPAAALPVPARGDRDADLRAMAGGHRDVQRRRHRHAGGGGAGAGAGAAGGAGARAGY